MTETLASYLFPGTYKRVSVVEADMAGRAAAIIEESVGGDARSLVLALFAAGKAERLRDLIVVLMPLLRARPADADGLFALALLLANVTLEQSGAAADEHPGTPLHGGRRDLLEDLGHRLVQWTGGGPGQASDDGLARLRRLFCDTEPEERAVGCYQELSDTGGTEEPDPFLRLACGMGLIAARRTDLLVRALREGRFADGQDYAKRLYKLLRIADLPRRELRTVDHWLTAVSAEGIEGAAAEPAQSEAVPAEDRSSAELTGGGRLNAFAGAKTAPVPYFGAGDVGGTDTAAHSGIDISVVAYERKEYTLRLLHSIAREWPDFEGDVVLFQNGSAESSARWLRERASRLPLRIAHHHSPEQLPITTARNQAFGMCGRPYVLSLDSDMIALPGVSRAVSWISTLLPAKFLNFSYLEHHDFDDYGIGKEWHVTRRERGPVLVMESAFRGGEAELAREGLFLSNRISGGCGLYERDAFFQIGGFCEEIEFGYEDVEFSIRLTKHGFVCLNTYAPLFFHSHLFPFSSEMQQAETRRFEPERIRAAIDLIERRHGIAIESRAAEGGPDRGQRRLAPIKERYYFDRRLDSSDGIVAVLLGASSRREQELEQELIERLSERFECCVFFAAEFVTVPRLTRALSFATVLLANAAAYASLLTGDPLMPPEGAPRSRLSRLLYGFDGSCTDAEESLPRLRVDARGETEAQLTPLVEAVAAQLSANAAQTSF